MNKNDEEWITAEASLIPLNSNRKAKETYKTIRPSKAAVEKAAQALQKLSFSIEAEGVVSISISGRKGTFEKVFDIQLEKRSQKVLEHEVKGNEPSYYAPIGKPKIPQELKDLVHEIVFPIPPTTFL
jgi:hypothetical protein